ncbi:hypothetical protein B0H14DRAFT_2564179 [Mycena olivaceomarginata]|nr:hypothetical protein B0H14DRAFT_2564179 [Mycena olivaceomarginata]
MTRDALRWDRKRLPALAGQNEAHGEPTQHRPAVDRAAARHDVAEQERRKESEYTNGRGPEMTYSCSTFFVVWDNLDIQMCLHKRAPEGNTIETLENDEEPPALLVEDGTEAIDGNKEGTTGSAGQMMKAKL